MYIRSFAYQTYIYSVYVHIYIYSTHCCSVALVSWQITSSSPPLPSSSSSSSYCIGILVYGSINSSAITFWAYTSHNLFSKFYVWIFSIEENMYLCYWIVSRVGICVWVCACARIHIYIIHGATLNKIIHIQIHIPNANHRH